MTDQTTQRISTTTALDHLRNVRARIATLTLRRCNNHFLTSEQNQELRELQAKRVKLEREYAEAMRFEQTKRTS